MKATKGVIHYPLQRYYIERGRGWDKETNKGIIPIQSIKIKKRSGKS